MSFCQYKNVFGEPGKGVHSVRFLGLAIIDVLMTIFGAYLIHLYFQYPFWLVLLILFSLAIFLHRLFCVRTTIDKLLFPNAK